MSTIAKADLVGGFLKGIKVIECFEGDRQVRTIAEVSRVSGLDRATSRRLLLTLVHAGLAEHDGKYFRLTPRILRLSHAYLGSASMPNILQTYLEQLSGEIHESCSASVLQGDQVVYVARASFQRVMSINLHVGSTLPLYCSSMGRVLLASLPREKMRALLESVERKALTPSTVTDIDALEAEIDRVRTDGYAIVDQELEIGLRSIAVPVRDSKDQVVAAINVGTNAGRVSRKRLIDEYLPKMRTIQRETAQVL